MFQPNDHDDLMIVHIMLYVLAPKSKGQYQPHLFF